MSQRYKIILAYNGTDYSGWQSQANSVAVQDVLEKAFGQLTQEDIKFHGCSRTDAGVHALEYIAHFDSPTKVTINKLITGANSLLPKAIAVLDIIKTDPDFHARKSAQSKIYEYRIFNREIRDPHEDNRSWHIIDNLDVESMTRASKDILGQHDFSCFQAADPKPRNPVRNINRLDIESRNVDYNGKELIFTIQSSGFLKYMIRNIIGTLVEIGRGQRPVDNIPDLINSKDRKKAGATAPACGLYLVKVFY